MSGLVVLRSVSLIPRYFLDWEVTYLYDTIQYGTVYLPAL